MPEYIKNTDIGNFKGNERENCFEFLGIEYAVAERFEYAKMIDDYTDYDATTPAPSSMQKRAWPEFEHLEIPERAFYNREFRKDMHFEYAEGKLYLNIFAPKSEDKHPVIVFFHGGGFDSGSINESPYDGSKLAEKGNVVVFVQYRVGVFGYLTHKDIYDKYGRDGNFGLDDMMISLKWIRKNISRFCGDENNITVMGQSAGAMSIQYLLCSKEADCLFDKAIMMSGAGLFPKFSLPRPYEQTRQYWEEVMDISGCKDFDQFKKLDAKKVLEAVDIQKSRRKDNTYNTMPVIDGYILKDGMDKLIENARELPLIIGFTNNDMFTVILSHISKKYAKKHSAYLYYFDVDAKGDDNQAFHSADLRYVFGTLETSWRPYDEADEKISEMMMDYFTSFSRSSDPNHEGAPEWKRYKGKALCISSSGIKEGRPGVIKLLRNTLKGDPK